jgi:hypothetical protein
MTIEIIAVVVLVFACTTAAAFLHERRMDVLHGPYVEQRDDRETKLMLAPRIADYFRWRARSMIYLTSIIAR